MPTKAEEEGSVTVWFRTTGSWVILSYNQYESILSDWKSAKAFGEYKGIHGSDEAIKLAEVQHIQRTTPEQWKAIQEEKRIDALENPD